MAKQRVRRSRFRLLISLLAAAVTLGVGARTLALIPGGHGAKTDCYSEFDIAGVTSTAPTKIQCMDGDPCDQDHMCNDTCTFKIRLCINNQNAVTGCTPPTTGLTKLKATPSKFRLTTGLDASKLSQQVCGDQEDVVVKVRKTKKSKKPGRQPLRILATAKHSKPDIDAVNLFCLPRPAGSACPTTTTSTTTSTTIGGCGNGVRDGSEECDGNDAAACGGRGCRSDCTCVPSPCPPATCTCAGGTPSKFTFVTAVGSGVCGHVDADGNPNLLQLSCGGLYFGGSGVGVPLPSKVPDQGSSQTRVCCNGTALTVSGTSASEAGGNRCAGGANHHNACTTDGDCPGGKCKLLQCTKAGCLFGPPLPVPNNNGAPTSTCVINVLSADASGMGDCNAGSTSNLSVPLSSQLFLTGDLMPMRCVGGSTPGAPCTGPGGCGTVAQNSCPGGTCVNDTSRCASGGGQAPNTVCCSAAGDDCIQSGTCNPGVCVGGSNADFGCITDADCPGGGACKTFIQPCPICNATTNTCNGGANDGLACTPGDTAIDGDYPTSHDCPPPPASNIGALPISFVLDSGTVTKTAVDLPGQVNVFCGFCRNKTLNTFARRCNGLATGASCGCAPGLPCATCPGSAPCLPVPCALDSDCTSVTGSTSCGQRTAGAFTANDVSRTIVETGMPAGALTTGGPAQPGTLVSIFCIPPSFTQTVDAAADLPGPGAVAIPGMAQALP